MGSLSSLEHMALLEPALWGASGIDGVIDVVAGMVYPGAAYPDSRKKCSHWIFHCKQAGKQKQNRKVIRICKVAAL